MLALLTRNNGAIESVERRCGMKAEVADLDELALPVTDLDHYELKEKLGGEAPLTAVWRAVHRPSEEDVAIKRVQLLEITRTLMECLDCEMSFLASVRHPNIIRLLGVIKIPSLGSAIAHHTRQASRRLMRRM